MSYELTDAGEAGMRKEVAVLDQLADDVDQLASDARDCETICPEARKLLDLCWWFVEASYREAHGHCSSPNHGRGGSCQCCRHYDELKTRAVTIRGRL